MTRKYIRHYQVLSRTILLTVWHTHIYILLHIYTVYDTHSSGRRLQKQRVYSRRDGNTVHTHFARSRILGLTIQQVSTRRRGREGKRRGGALSHRPLLDDDVPIPIRPPAYININPTVRTEVSHLITRVHARKSVSTHSPSSQNRIINRTD